MQTSTAILVDGKQEIDMDFDADFNGRNGRTHYDDADECVEDQATHCTAVCVDGVHVNKTFATPFDALDWAVLQPNCEKSNFIFFRYER